MNNTGADQPVHPRSLISAFIRFLKSIICNLVTDEISIFLLVSVAEETGMKLSFFRNPEDKFSRDEAHIMYVASTKFVQIMPRLHWEVTYFT